MKKIFLWSSMMLTAFILMSGTALGAAQLTLSSDMACDQLTIAASSTLTVGANTLDVGTGGIAIEAGGTLTSGSGTIQCAGNWSNSGTFTPGTGTVVLDGTNQFMTGSSTFNKLTKTVSSAATLTFQAGGTTTVTNTLTLQGASGALLSLRSSSEGTRWNIDPTGTRVISYVNVKDSNNIDETEIDATTDGCVDSGNNIRWSFPSRTTAQDGNWNDTDSWTGGELPAAGDNVILSHNVTLNTNAEIQDLTVNAGKTLTIDGSSTLTVNGTLTAAGSTITFSGAGTLVLAGTAACDAFGTFNCGTGTVIYSAGGDQNIDDLIYYNLTTSGSGTKTLCGDVTVENTLNTGASTTFALGTNTLNIGSASAGTGSWTNNATFGKGTGTVNYAENGDQTLLVLDYYGLGVSGTGSTKTFAEGTTKVDTEISLTDTLTLTGSSADAVTVQVTEPGVTQSRVFKIDAPGKTITVSNITIKGGDITNNATFPDADDRRGGCIYVANGTLNLQSARVSMGEAQTGGGIYGSDGTTIIVTGSTISGNTAITANGGGIDIRQADNPTTLTMAQSTVSGNTCGNEGGGIYASQCEGITLTDVTVSGNKAAYYGGGVYCYGGPYRFTNSIVAYNYLNNDTYSDIHEEDSPSNSTRIYGNYNIAGDWDAGWGGTGNNAYTYPNQGKGDPLFASYTEILADTIHQPVLADNGGTTQTVELARNSIAVETGVKTGTYDNAGTTKYAYSTDGTNWLKVEDGTDVIEVVTEITTDQRSADRHDTPCIGAYECYADYTTKAAGAWGNPESWQVFNGINTINATTAPSANDSTSITVNHDIGMGESRTIDQTTINADKTLTVDMNGGTLTIADGNGTDLTVTGSLVNADADNNTITCETDSTILFNGGNQPLPANSTCENVTIDGGGTKTLAGACTINKTLTLTDGLVALGENNLTLGENAVVSGTPSASNMIVNGGTGVLKKVFTGTGSFVFPLGDNTDTAEYSPATLNFTAGTFNSAWAGVRVTNDNQPDNTSTDNYLNRYWTVTQSGISDFSCNTAFTYVPTDVAGTEALIYGAKYSNSTWTQFDLVNTANHSFSGTVSEFSDFTGICLNSPPTVSTQAVTDITTSSATGNGTITDLGTANPTAYGVCWSTTLNPTTADANINQGATGSTGAFTANLTGLSAGTTYHVRAYATNTAGTSYGEDVSFTTTSPLPSPAWYTVTFNLDGKGTRTGGGALVQSIKGGSSASAPLVQANSGYSFTGWDQSFSNVQASMTVTAQYTTQTFTLSYTAGTGGTITGTSPQIVNRGASGSPVTASPLAGYRFTGWNDGSKANPRTDTNVTSNISVKASFALLTYKLTVQAGTGDGAYAPGTVVSITADPASEGMIFDQWTGQTSNVANVNLAGTSLTMPASDVTVTAAYKEKPVEKFILTVTDGTGSGSYEAGTVISISASPAPDGMIFDKWTGQTANIANLNLANTSLTMPESDVAVTATYKEKPVEKFILTVTDGTGSGSYEAGTVISISASPAPEGMIFDQWTGHTANVANVNLANTSLTMPESDVTVTAAYKEKSMEKFMLAVTDGTGDGSYEAGEVVSISAGIAPKGMIFDKWTGQTATIANTNLANTSLTMPESDVTVTATYRQKPVEKFSLVVDSGTGDGEYKAGRIVTIAATPAEDGLIFHRWTGQTSNVSNVNIPNTTITMPGRSVRVRAVYKADPGASFVLQIRIQTQGDGVGTTLRSSTKTLRNGEERDETIPAGQLVVLTAPDPPEGYMFDKWTGQTEYITNINLPETTMYMPDADVVVIATYRPLQAEVDLSVLDGSGSGIYAPETIVPIMADPAPDGEMFDKWMGQTANVVNINLPETSLIMPGVDVAVQAVYCEMPGEIFELTVVNGSGSGSYPAASLVEVTADPAPEGYMFDKWMGQNATVDDIFNPETFVFMPPNEAMIIATYALSGDEPDDPDEPDENDTDQDGVLDAWEIANYGDILLDAEDYDAMDTDGDGYTDLEEYQRGTDIRILDNLVTGYLVLLNDAGYTLSDGTRTKVYGNDSANYLMLETGAAAECMSFPGENTFILPSEAWLFTVSRSGAAVTLKGQDHTRLVLPATTTKQTIAFSDGAATLKIEDGSVFLGDQLITTSPSPVVTTLEALPEITEHPSGDIENPDAYLLLTGEKPYTIRKGTTTEVYGNADMNMLLLEGGAAARLYSFSNTNTFSIGAASTLFTVSRSGTTVTISGSDGTLLIVGATLNAQQISFTDITLEMLIESEKVILGEQVVEIEPLPVE